MSIIEPNTNELLEHADTRYTLVVEAAKRGRQIVAGSQPLFEADKQLKPLKYAVNEIKRDLIEFERSAADEASDLE